MKKSYILLSALLVSASMLTGCNDFLEPKAKSEFVPKDAQSLNELLLGEAYLLKTSSNFEGFLGLMDDDVAAAPYQVPPELKNMDYLSVPFTWQSNLWDKLREANINVPNFNIYKTHYSKILGCNAVIDYIGQINDTQENVNSVLAQAYALRGFYYLHLVNIFGEPYNANPNGMGVVLKTTSGIEDKPLARSSVAQVYEQIFSDLHEAERLYETLPESMQWQATFRTNLPMVQLLLSRAYLYTENWAEAARYAKLIMDNPRFSYVDLRLIDSKDANGQNIYTDFQSFDNSPEVIWPYGNVSDFCLWRTQYEQTSDRRYIHSYFRASDDLMKEFDATPGDLRKDRYVICSWFTVPDGQGNEVPMPQAIGKVSYSSQYVALGSQNNYGRTLRLSEATLNYAEARANMPGGDGDALQALNAMRVYRFSFTDYTPITAADCPDGVLNFVRDERRRELCYEGHRWFDLRRWGMPEIKHVWYPDENTALEYTLSQGDPLYTLPVPDVSLEQNPELTQAKLGPVPRKGVNL